MTAFLFIPPTIGTPLARRVDLDNIASLFGGSDELLAVPQPQRRAILSALLAMLAVLGIFGDLMLVACPDRVAAEVAAPKSLSTLEGIGAKPGGKTFSPASAA